MGVRRGQMRGVGCPAAYPPNARSPATGANLWRIYPCGRWGVHRRTGYELRYLNYGKSITRSAAQWRALRDSACRAFALEAGDLDRPRPRFRYLTGLVVSGPPRETTRSLATVLVHRRSARPERPTTACRRTSCAIAVGHGHGSRYVWGRSRSEKKRSTWSAHNNISASSLRSKAAIEGGPKLAVAILMQYFRPRAAPSNLFFTVTRNDRIIEPTVTKGASVRFLPPVLVLLTAAALPLTADVMDLDFEGFPDGTILATQYPGVTFTNAIILTAGISLNEFDFPPHSGTNVASDNNGPMSIDFANPVLSFGGYFTYVELLTIQAFNTADIQVASASSLFSQNFVSSGNPANEFIRVAFAEGISSVTITGDPSGGSFTLDDATYTTTSTSVPEPSTWSLMLFTGAAIMLLKRGARVTSSMFIRRAWRGSDRGVARPLPCLVVVSLLLAAPGIFAQVSAVGVLGVRPAAVNVGVPTTLTVTSRITAPNVVPGSPNVQLLNAQGQAQSVLGVLHDDGVPPDLVASDGVYSGNIVLNQAQTGNVSVRVSAAIRGSLLRLFSSPMSIDVLPPGIPTTPVSPDLSKATTDPVTGEQIIGNEILICFTPTTTFLTITTDARLVSASIIGRFSGLGNCYQFGLPAGSDGSTVEGAVGTLKLLPEVVSVEPDAVSTSSSGPCYTCGTLPYNLLRLDNAHIVSTGLNTWVAVLDTGISPAYTLTNYRIISGPDELLGGSVNADYNGHGTFVAGIVGATAPDANIYVIRTLDNAGQGSWTTVIAGIQDATNASVDVINMSLGASQSSSILQRAIQYASSRNVVLVAAAGNGNDNDGIGQSAILQYPAAIPGVLSVGATVGTSPTGDTRASFSNFGNWVHIAAPGVSVVSYGIPGPSPSASGSGTSFSTPFVSGTAALVKSINRFWTAAQVVNQIEQTVTPLSGDFAGIGRVAPVQQVNVQVTGPGSVTLGWSDGLTSNASATPSSVSCTSSSPCSQWFLGTTAVTLAASSAVTWGVDCASFGTSTTITVPLTAVSPQDTADKNCTATFGGNQQLSISQASCTFRSDITAVDVRASGTADGPVNTRLEVGDQLSDPNAIAANSGYDPAPSCGSWPLTNPPLCQKTLDSQGAASWQVHFVWTWSRGRAPVVTATVFADVGGATQQTVTVPCK